MGQDGVMPAGRHGLLSQRIGVVAIVGHRAGVKADAHVHEISPIGGIVAQRSNGVLKPLVRGAAAGDWHREQDGDARRADLAQNARHVEQLVDSLVRRGTLAYVHRAQMHESARWSARVGCCPACKSGEHLVCAPAPMGLVVWRHGQALVVEIGGLMTLRLVEARRHRAHPRVIDACIHQRAPKPVAPARIANSGLRDAVANRDQAGGSRHRRQERHPDAHARHRPLRRRGQRPPINKRGGAPPSRAQMPTHPPDRGRLSSWTTC